MNLYSKLPDRIPPPLLLILMLHKTFQLSLPRTELLKFASHTSCNIFLYMKGLLIESSTMFMIRKNEKNDLPTSLPTSLSELFR